MKVGSLVECINNKMFGSKVNIPELATPYTIRWIGRAHDERNNSSGVGLYLEEIINSKDSGNGLEYAYRATSFKELQPPMTICIDELIEEPLNV